MTEKRKSARTRPSKTEGRAAVLAGKAEELPEKITISLSIDRELLRHIDKRWKNLPGLNRSSYFEILAQNDLKSGGSLTILEKAKTSKGSADILK